MKKSALVLAAILALAALPLRAAVAVKTLQSTSELPGPLAAFVQKGNVLARNGKFLAVAGGVPRRLVSSFNSSLAEVKFDQKIRLELEGDAWIAVEVVGARTLFPVLQRIAGSGRPADAALSYALTNPILVDGNGRFDPPWKDKVRIK
jgi:hypothetical protein